jgi:hypothetical protein
MDNSSNNISLFRFFMALFNSNTIELLSVIAKYASRVWSSRIHEGMYEVLDYQSVLELKDAKGLVAILHKRQQVRFLQANIIAYQDKAWGDGDIFADYKCSSGVMVDKYREGHRYLILISLRGTKNRGDVEEFQIERTIRRGFTKPTEDFQTDIDHTTRRLSLSIIFPRHRFPKKVELIEQNTTFTQILSTEHQKTLPDGRLQVTWMTDKPKLFEGYILRWVW